jgi:hypothetical protein
MNRRRPRRSYLCPRVIRKFRPEATARGLGRECRLSETLVQREGKSLLVVVRCKVLRQALKRCSRCAIASPHCWTVAADRATPFGYADHLMGLGLGLAVSRLPTTQHSRPRPRRHDFRQAGVLKLWAALRRWAYRRGIPRARIMGLRGIEEVAAALLMARPCR